MNSNQQSSQPKAPDLEAACTQAAQIPRNTLLGYAIARGCSHFAPFVPAELRNDQGDLLHEVLGCALMIGPEDVDTFQAIRCAAMVISDLGNSTEALATAAKILKVEARLIHVAQLGLKADSHPNFWQALIDQLPPAEGNKPNDFLPGISRLTLETGKIGPGQGPARRWLRTTYHEKK